jgi:hypothetical protein
MTAATMIATATIAALDCHQHQDEEQQISRFTACHSMTPPKAPAQYLAVNLASFGRFC